MKKRFTFIILISVFLFLLIFRHQYTSSSPGLKPENEIKPIAQPEKNPLEIEGILNDYDQWLTKELNTTGTVGAAVAIIYKNQIALLKTFGVKKAGKNDSIDEHTIFRLASVSKTVTGVLAGILENEQVINLDDKVIDYLPGFRLKNPESTRKITIRNLLSHTSGLIPHAYDTMVEDKASVKKILEVIDEVSISAEPGQLYSYQNVMFSLLDTILMVKTSKGYGELVREKIFAPFGMKNASTDFHSFKSSINKALPHVRGKGKYWPQKLNDRYYITAPAAGVNASITDMAQFLLALQNNNTQGLNENIQQTVFTPQVISPLPRRYFSNWTRVDSKHYAIGWRIVRYKGRTVAYHGGYVQGYKAEIALCKSENAGIVYLSNSPNSLASKTVPRFLDLLFEFQDTRQILTDKSNHQSEDNKI